jgi:ubiquinone/menaquinone biosynthesis C-methylase UbiE
MEQDFDRFAENYRQIHTVNVKGIAGVDSYYFAEYKIKELLQFEKNSNSVFLDLGCGDGATEFFLQQYFPKIKVHAIDVSAKSIEMAESRRLNNSTFRVFDGSKIPFSESKFDIVFVAGVLHHVSPVTQKLLLTEINRVLKPGGRLYVFEHNPLNPFTRYLVMTCEFDKGVKLLSGSYCRSLLVKTGFAVKEFKYTIFFPRKRMFNSLIKFEKYLSKIPFGGQYYFRAVKP